MDKSQENTELPDRHCGNCLCCINKSHYPFCFEQNKIVQIGTEACKEYEKGDG